MNNLELLLQTVKEKINYQSPNISHTEILNLIDKNFYALEALKFSTLLSNEVVKPIAIKIKDLEQTKDSLGSSRTNHKQRNHVLSNINDLKGLLTEVFVSYKHHLKEDDFFQIYEKEENKKYSNFEDKIINGSLDEDALESIMYPTYFDLEKIQNLSSVIKEHFMSLNLDKDNYNFAKDRTKSFYSRIKDSFYTISKTIDKTNADLKETKKKLTIIKEDEVYQDYENSTTYNLKDYYYDLEIDLSFNLDNLESHKTLLADLLKDLTKSYPYLEVLGGFTLSKTTVFGNSNFEVIKQLVFQLKQEGFVSMKTDDNDLMDVFTLNEEMPKKKINLDNGTHADYGYLISKMRPFFIDRIRSKAKYNEWWSKHFTFSLVDKNKKEVSNMVTSLKYRRSTKMQSISKIIESLNPIPQ